MYLILSIARSHDRHALEDKARDVIKKAKVEDDEYHKNSNEEQTYYRYVKYNYEVSV